MDIAEFILKMFSIGFIIAGILGMILQTISFQGYLHTYDDMRLAVDFANAAAAAPCLAENVGNDVRKGVIDSSKFHRASTDFCLKLAKPYKLKITKAGQEIFSTGTLTNLGVSQKIPVAVKTGDQYSTGFLYVEIGS